MKSLHRERFAVGVAVVLLGAGMFAQAKAPEHCQRRRWWLRPQRLRAAQAPASGLRLATFDVNATPPVGSAMAYDPVKRVDEMSLRCRGIVLLGAGQPIALCAVDWIGIANEGQDAFRAALAEAAGTTPDRVAVHTVHQHDAPDCDFTAERLIREMGLKEYGPFEGTFQRQVIRRMADAVREALPRAQPVTHYGWGVAEVREVASNRRIKGPDGKVRATLHDHQGPCVAGRTGRRDRSASVAGQLLE